MANEKGPWTPIPAGLSKMTLRERWRRAMSFQKADRLPMLEFGYWDETLPAWHEQGLPTTVATEADAYAYFGIEDWRKAPINVGLHPAVEEKIIERGKDYVLWRDADGALRMEKADGVRTIPHYVEYGIKNREDWKRF